MHHGDTVENSAIGELVRSKDNILANRFLERVELMSKLHDMIKKIESKTFNRKL